MCYRPILIPNKHGVLFDSYKHIYVKCRQCLECRQERAKEWALLCMFENNEHRESCFVTLTYDEQHNPIVLRKSHMQNFMKRLRKSVYPRKIRYFSCGEYGSKNYRPHFHILIFGYDFNDKYLDKMSPRGYPIYNSPKLEKLWGKGLVTVQDVTKNSSAYCALYSSKYKTSLPPHLRNNPEFNTMSHSLGVERILKLMDKFIQTDEIYLDGFKHNIPDKVLKKYCAQTSQVKNEIERIKRKWQSTIGNDDLDRLDKLLRTERAVLWKSPEYRRIKTIRLNKGQSNEHSILFNLDNDRRLMIEQAQYRKENAIKRLRKQL